MKFLTILRLRPLINTMIPNTDMTKADTVINQIVEDIRTKITENIRIIIERGLDLEKRDLEIAVPIKEIRAGTEALEVATITAEAWAMIINMKEAALDKGPEVTDIKITPIKVVTAREMVEINRTVEGTTKGTVIREAAIVII